MLIFNLVDLCAPSAQTFLLRLGSKMFAHEGRIRDAVFADCGTRRKNGGTERSFLHQNHTRTRTGSCIKVKTHII